jgi:CubicO group peptidase (beta-lactamase class C family)
MNQDDFFRKIELDFFQKMRKAKIPGASLALVDREGNLLLAGYGVTGRDQPGRTVTAQTLFSMQSISKTYTAVAVLLAVQDGLLDLDQPLSRYLPGFHLRSPFEPSPERVITLRLLLSHRAGLVHEAPVGSNFDVDIERFGFADHIASIQQTWLRFPVGSRYAYSNLGVDLAGWVLQKISSQSFPEYVRQRLFDPLGLHHSTFDPATQLVDTDRALGYDPFFRSVRKALPIVAPMTPSAGLYASAEDAGQFLRLLLNRGDWNGRSFLDEKLLDEMYAFLRRQLGQMHGYGLGVGLNWRWGGPMYHHSGGGFGFLADLMWQPELGLGVAFLTNTTQHSLQYSYPVGLLDSLVEALRPEVQRSVPKHLPASTELPVETIAMQPETLAPWGGRYYGRIPSRFDLCLRRGRLWVRTNRVRKWKPLTFVAPDLAWFGTPGERMHLRFQQDSETAARHVVLVEEGWVFDRDYGSNGVSQPPRKDWKDFSGSYLALALGLIPELIEVKERGGLFVQIVSLRTRLRLEQHQPGLFFTCTGEALDFNENLFMGIRVQKIDRRRKVQVYWAFLRSLFF